MEIRNKKVLGAISKHEGNENLTQILAEQFSYMVNL